MEYLLNILSGGSAGAALIWLARNWISKRIKHEYSEKLESYKAELNLKVESYKTELNLKVESIKHENQVLQLRTSLFFDHQRDAFASLINKIENLNYDWMTRFDREIGLVEPVPSEGHREFKSLIYKHMLFLDEECLLVLSLIENAYNDSLSQQDDEDVAPIVAYIKYLQPRIASIFRTKIGVISNPEHLIDVAILSGVEIVNNNFFLGYGSVSIENSLIIKVLDKHPSNMVAVGRANFYELINDLKICDSFLNKNGNCNYDGLLKIKSTIEVLDKIKIRHPDLKSNKN